jgi:hypothetical protein
MTHHFPYEMYHSHNNMATKVKGKSVDALEQAARKQGIKAWSIFRVTPNFHSTTQEEYLVRWYDETNRDYWSNRAVKEPELLGKKVK